MENGGIFVAKAKNLSLAGGTSKISSVSLSSSLHAPYMSPRLISSPSPHTNNNAGGGSASSHLRSPAGGGGGGGSRTPSASPKAPFASMNNIRRDTALIGQTVRISQGPYKGYVGIVKDATESTCKVELHAKCQTITVDRNRIVPTTSVHFLLLLLLLREIHSSFLQKYLSTVRGDVELLHHASARLANAVLRGLRLSNADDWQPNPNARRISNTSLRQHGQSSSSSSSSLQFRREE